MENDKNNNFSIEKNEFGIYPIHIRTYKKYILLQGLEKEFIINKLKSYAELAYSKIYVYKIKITLIENTDWSIISLPRGMDFFNFHNLVGWFVGSMDQKKAKQIICVALHHDKRYSYYAIIKDRDYADTLIGRFQNGESFYIILPDTPGQDGNARQCEEVLPEKSIIKYLESCGFNYNYLEMINTLPYSVVILEID